MEFLSNQRCTAKKKEIHANIRDVFISFKRISKMKDLSFLLCCCFSLFFSRSGLKIQTNFAHLGIYAQTEMSLWLPFMYKNEIKTQTQQHKSIQWLGFGPETPNIPPEFELPVSSLSQYGGHSSLHIRYDPFATTPLYKRSSGAFNNEPAPGDSIAYLQLGVPQYRISQMVKYGGNVLDAYGWVNVVSPSGLPVRGIVGITADPIMFLAVNCVDVAKSEEFYAKLGFVRQVRYYIVFDLSCFH